ncbi:TOPRIM nucleotidyl transferase/hydrolase domain-containing protein [Phosphitispora fastidiosa]|uniref:TOPRIM nucleotidyl transferase/hydrolase domain-containing protein n=1 Tax=Phosphitispora fastidiosa TaxID=2837202 RepID=UPI001E5FEFAC|nr:TOPRIM nucleotidyl transferase/hydrolase domain-containing protein [Phosphitispora fastidiosa]MBU7007509.1 hypothetical protein [Phosphitispora fastidiosa]
MKKKRDTPPPKRGIVIFVEGETEKVFYEAIIKHLRELNPEKQCVEIVVKNVKGVGNYGSKAPRKLKNEILPKYPGVDFTVICCYDADRFKYDAKPPVKWKEVEKEIKS